MDDIFDLLITPFNDIVAKGQIAVENAGDDGPMLKAAQSLVTEGERALNKIEPLYRMLLDKHGSKFQDFLKENDAISNLHSELNDLLWEFDDYIELDDFEPEKFAELESVSRSAAPKIYDILTGMKLEVLTDHDTGMKLEVPTDHDTGMKLEVPTDHDYRLSLLPTLSLPHTRSLLKSPTESVETNQSSVFDHSRTDGINTPFPDHHGSSISTADSNPILSTAELNPLLIKVPSIKNYQGAVKPEKPIRVPEVDYFPIPVETEVQTPQHPPNPPNPFAVDCKLGPQSSFYVHKGFCDGVKEIINGGPGVRKTVKAGFASRTVIAKCITCHFELDFKALDLDINKSEHGNFIKNGIGYRLRFLQKSHLPTRRSDDIMYGCIFCVHQGQTLHASDATVFVSQKALFAHLARHPRPLPAVPGFTLIEQDEIPNRYKNNYDLHFKSPVETHPVLEKSDDICRMPAGISKEAARRMYGQQLLYDRTPALELVQGARIVGLSWPAKYLGEWCFGWHDGVYASLPMNILRLDPPPSSDIKTDGTSLVMATARWNFNIRDKFNHNWLKFEKDEVITNITWPYQEFWCWSGTNAKGKSGIFPQAFIDISTLKEFGGPGYDQADRASVLNNERRRNKSFSVPLRFSFRKKSRADIPASIPRSASSRELPPLLTPIPGAYTRDDPSAWDKTQAESLLPILDQQKTKDYKIEASPATNNLDHDQSLGEATNMESINEELLLDMKLEEVHQFGKCWTCSPIDSISTDKVPITISDVPVVIPVESRYPLRAPVTPPPDPHPKFIDPTRQITDNVISEIFRVYEDALGFYLLINGQLQIIIPDDFDYQYALSHRPREFGGLEVSYIMESMTPTAGITSQASAQVPQISTNASIPAQLAPGVNSTAGQSPTAHIDAMLKLTIGSAIQASVKGTKLKDRFEGRVGLMTRMGDRTFVTIPTHVVTSALTAAKSASFPGDSWINDVQIVSSNGNKELGPISETFDPAAGHFPLGFIHDVSLVDVSNAPVELVSNIKTPFPTEWLSNSGWQEIRYRTTRLHLLKHVSIVPSRQANIKSIGLLECQCQAVGQGIFRMRQPPRTTRFSLRRPSTGLDVRQDSEVWTGLVARSLLFRIHPDFRPDGAQSGTALCTMEELEDGTRCAKVAGFTAFAQDVSVVQNFDLEGPRLYSRLEQGRVAFYGAFQVPEVLREKHHIM